MLKKTRKALAAFFVPFAGSLIVDASGGLTSGEIGTAIGLGVAAALAVFGVKNAPWKAGARP